MNEGYNMQFGVPPDQGFTVQTIAGCRVVFGAFPAADFAMLSRGFSKKALVAVDIADRIGATIVIGEPDDLETLRKMDIPVSQRRLADSLAATERGLDRVAIWLRTGERGASSNAMCKRFFGLPTDGGIAHPQDPADLRRCLVFLDSVGAHDNISLMQDVSPQWAALMNGWEKLTAQFAAESGQKSAPKTYALMQRLLTPGDSNVR